MRAESLYRKDAISPVGALGLMQVMPETGRNLASLMGDKDFNPRSLLQPEQAILYGGRYLSRLMQNFNQSMPLTAASYNAGPHRAQLWLSLYGNLSGDEFIEHIPFTETRNYVKKVMSNYYIYSKLYEDPKLNLAQFREPFTLMLSGTEVPLKESWNDL
jgi:soluble lytic murein transglycosylase